MQIPRLLIHADEIPKIIQCSKVFYQNHGVEQVLIRDLELRSSSDVSDEDGSTLCHRIAAVIRELSRNIRHAPAALALRLANDLKLWLKDAAGLERLPSIIEEDIQQTTVAWIVTSFKELDQILTRFVTSISEIPETSGTVVGITISFPIAALIFVCSILLLPLRPVDDGPKENRVFSYGVIPMSLFILVSTFMMTCNCAMPDVKISAFNNLLTSLLCTTTGVAIYFLLAWGILTENPIFPVPFSVLVAGLPATLGVAPALYLFTPQTNRGKGQFRKVFQLHVIYWFSVALAVAWAIGINRLRNNPSVLPFMSILYPLLRFVCKILLCASLTNELNAKRGFHLNHMVDIIFRTVSCCTYPFIDAWWNTMWLFFCEVGTVLWRLYSGVDRVGLFWAEAKRQFQNDDESNEEVGPGKRFSGIVRGIKYCFSSPATTVHQMTKQLSRSTLRTFITFDDDESSQCPTDEKKMHCPELGNVERFSGHQEGSETTSSAKRDSDNHVGLDRDQVRDIFRPKSDNFPKEQAEPEQVGIPPESREKMEEHFHNRYLFHVVDGLVTLALNIIHRLTLYAGTNLVQHLPTKNHLNSSFQIDQEQWENAQLWGAQTIFYSIVVFTIAACLSQRNFKRFEMEGFNIRGVLLYALGHHYWNYLMWILTGSMLFTCAMINHFGFDFTTNFAYLDCLKNTAWPGCPAT
ncbi:hypothetical protein IV203_013383 [Nitzschia inconspicua]|uniref:Uncharacterized protein n=1 Tax=Nitzschia inconspicua TaxID=303405 RepID=A0A9K3M505_9STRA|nr:hypothetical protein IV203_013383 [Nitzschia inconspicua]